MKTKLQIDPTTALPNASHPFVDARPAARSALFLLLLIGSLLAGENPPAAPATAAAPALAWGRQLGTAADDFAPALAVNRDGQSYLAGGTAGDLAATNAGKKDFFAASFDPDGRRLWAVQLGSAEDEAANSIALAPDGNLYVGGMTSGKLGSGGLRGGSDVFIAKLNPAGHVLWLEQFGTAANDGCGAIACDAQGNVFLTGSTEGKMDGKQFGGTDAFLLKVSPDGALLWACQWGTDGADASHGLAVDPEGNLYVTGSTTGSFAGNTNAGATDIFVSAIDRAGKPVWSRQFGTPAPDSGMNLRVDAAHGLYVAGSSGGELAAPQLGEGDSFVLHLSPVGDLLWKKQFGTVRWDGVHGVALSPDHDGGVLVGGCQNWDQCQGFLREFDAAGHERWSTTIPSGQTICGTQVAIDGRGNIYQTGGTHGSAFGEYRGTGNDIILVKLAAAPALLP